MNHIYRFIARAYSPAVDLKPGDEGWVGFPPPLQEMSLVC